MVAAKRAAGVRPYVREFKSGDRWWWVALPGRQRKALNLREAEATYDDALRLACERYVDGAREVAPGAAGAPAEATLERVVEAYLDENAPRWKGRTAAGYELLLIAFEEAMRDRGLTLASQVTSEHWSVYLAGRLAGGDGVAGVSNATLNRTIAIVRPMARWAREREPALIPAPVYLERIKNLPEIERVGAKLVPSPAEWTRVVSELKAGVKPLAHQAARYRATSEINDRGCAMMVAIAVQTGERIDEMRHMRAEDVGRDEVRVVAYEGWTPKRHRERAIPVPPSTVKLARQFVAWRDGARGLNGADIALGEGWINDRLDEAWARLKLGDPVPRMHDCRRTFATELLRSGLPITMVRDRLGHRDVKTTERYLGRYRSDAARPVVDLGVGAAFDDEHEGEDIDDE